MPNKKSAAKRVRQNEKRRIRNRAKRSDMRSAVKDVNSAIAGGSVENLEKLLSEAQSKLGKAAKTNLIKKEKASRVTSRLAKAIAKAKAAKTPA